MPEKVTVRETHRGDIPAILGFIRELAEYEKLSHQVIATEANLEKHLFDDHRAEVLLVEIDGRPVGFALFFTNFSTFLGKPGMYLEDLYIRPDFRNRGIGKRLFAELGRIATDRDYGRLEWAVLDWNTPSIGFYRSLGARAMDEWTVFRLSGDPLRRLPKL